jgi:hypothetical protein
MNVKQLPLQGATGGSCQPDAPYLFRGLSAIEDSKTGQLVALTGLCTLGAQFNQRLND